jgi:crossover junction endodeoxyribonuclease RusA
VISFDVHGIPAPQGSKNPWGGEANKNTRPWRAAVTAEAAAAMNGREPLSGPVQMKVEFSFPRPKSHYGTGRNADAVKQGAPFYVTRAPDVDKLARAVADALTGIVYRDDSQISHLNVWKVYGPPKATVAVRELTLQQDEE